MGLFSKTASTTNSTVINEDNRSVAGEDAIIGSNNSVSNFTTNTQTNTDFGAIEMALGANAQTSRDAFAFGEKVNRDANRLGLAAIDASLENSNKLQASLTKLGQMNTDLSVFQLKQNNDNNRLAFDFVGDQVGKAQTQTQSAFVRALDFSGDASRAASSDVRGATSQAFSFAKAANDDSKTATGRALDAIGQAYSDAKGAGQRGDKLIMMALGVAGVVAAVALLGRK